MTLGEMLHLLDSISFHSRLSFSLKWFFVMKRCVVFFLVSCILNHLFCWQVPCKHSRSHLGVWRCPDHSPAIDAIGCHCIHHLHISPGSPYCNPGMQSRCITFTLHLLLTPFPFLLYKKETCPQKWLLVPYGLQCPSFSSDRGVVWRQWGSLLTLGLCLSTPGPWWHLILQGLLVPLWCPMLALPGQREANIQRGPDQGDAAHQSAKRAWEEWSHEPQTSCQVSI